MGTVTIPQLDQALRAEYERLFETCRPRPERVAAVDTVVDRLVAARPRYAALEAATGAPWYLLAIIHSLEAGQRFDRHLHNGDPLTARTTHVPAGRPAHGKPPFTWEASAQDALQSHGFDKWKDWSFAGVLFKLEQYNGWGYRQHHPGVFSPYLWSFSTHYTKGKYVADGRFDANAVSQQCGGAVVLRRMVDRALLSPPIPVPLGPLFRYTGGDEASFGRELQRFLNTLPGNALTVDGLLGPNSSQAVQRAFGNRLDGDPEVLS